MIHGPLDDFSAIAFEDYLGKLEALVDSSRSITDNPLVSLKNRLSEINKFNDSNVPSEDVPEYSHQQTRKFPCRPADSFILTSNDKVIQIQKVVW